MANVSRHTEPSKPAGALDALADVIAAAVAERVLERLHDELPTQEGSPALLDRRALARELGVCLDVVDRLRREGAPELIVGDVPRFELARVIEWLRARPAPRKRGRDAQ